MSTSPAWFFIFRLFQRLAGKTGIWGRKETDRCKVGIEVQVNINRDKRRMILSFSYRITSNEVIKSGCQRGHSFGEGTHF